MHGWKWAPPHMAWKPREGARTSTGAAWCAADTHGEYRQMRFPHPTAATGVGRAVSTRAVVGLVLMLFLSTSFATRAQEPAADQQSTSPPVAESETSDPPTLEVSVDVTAFLPEVDRLIAAEGQRVGAAEGAQLISADYIRAQQASTLADALRKTTSVQVDEEGGQQGSIVIIRGLSQDQVSVRVEGAPKNFNQARHGGAGTIWLEPDIYKSLVVVPGVASNVYGNGSLGGVILLETKDPEDVIRQGAAHGANLRTGYENNGESLYISGDTAYRFNDVAALNATYTRRDTAQYRDGAGNLSLGGATGSDDHNVLLKGVVAPAAAGRLELSYVGLRKNYTARGGRSRGLLVSSTDEFTNVEEDTYTLQYAVNPPNRLWFDMNVRASLHKTARDRRADGSSEITNWNVDTRYLEIANTSTFAPGGALLHTLRYGADYTQDDVLSAYFAQDGGQLERGRSQFGAYLSETFLIGQGLELVGSLRYDSVGLQSGIKDASSTALSPKVGAYWRPFEQTAARGLSAFVMAGAGFRAPSAHEVFGRGESDVQFCVRRGPSEVCSLTRPNPNLNGEDSRSWETGISYARGGRNDLTFRLTYIQSDIDNLIVLEDTGVESINQRLTSIRTFRNVDRAKISGFESSVNYAGNHWFGSVTAQNLTGLDLESGDDLRDVSPASVNASIGAYLFDHRSRFGLDVSRRDDKLFEPDVRFSRIGYTIYDLFGMYQFNDTVLFRARIANLTNELYTKRYRNLSIDTDGFPQDLTYYQPGRNLKLTLEFDF